MTRFAPWLAVGFFAILGGLEIAHGVARLDALRRERRTEIVEGAARALSELAGDLRSKGADAKRHAAYVSRLPDAAALARGAGATAASAREALTGLVLAQLVTFPEIDRVRILDASGRTSFRCERMGGGVAAIPEGLLPVEPDAAAQAIASRLLPGEVAVTDLFYDRGRVEVPEIERKVLHCVAKSALTDFPGFVVVTVYASPMLDEVRRFAPVEGAASFLVSGDGAYVAAPDRNREIGGSAPSTLLRDRPEAAPLLHGATSIESAGGVLLATAVGELPWVIVTDLPAAALAAATERMSEESRWVMLVMAVVLAALLAAAVVFYRLTLRAFRLREAEAALLQLEQRREIERRLSTAERLSSLGLLTAGVAHEINNPLEGIANYLSLLDHDALPAEKRKRYVDSVRHGFERIRGVVRTLLGFARPGGGAGIVDVRRVVGQALDLARFSNGCRAVTFEVLGGDEPVTVNGDAGAIEQILLNLFLNAGHAMKGSGRIEVIVERSGGDVHVHVDDSGPGIPPENLPRVFDPFFTTGEGSGLGLSVSHGIAQAHGGALSAANRPAGGARFTLRLPVAEPIRMETHGGSKS